jgi:hypothetical protein
VFYVTLRGGDTSFACRDAALGETDKNGRSRYRHRGRFALELLQR